MTDSVVFPWLKHLPEDEQYEMYAEILQVAAESQELGSTLNTFAEKLEVCLAPWKSTAVENAEREAAKALTSPHNVAEDFGEVPRPSPGQHRCGASLPHEKDEDGWRYCCLVSGHTTPHMDAEDWLYAWEDGTKVEVTSVDDVRAVPDHIHEFVGDEDTCTRYRACQLTWGMYNQLRREWDEKSTKEPEADYDGIVVLHTCEGCDECGKSKGDPS